MPLFFLLEPAGLLKKTKQRPMMTLTQWQAHLADHYKKLSVQRKQSGDGSVFVLEHGLGSGEISEMSALLKEQIKSGPPRRDTSLAWLVYSTELGYRYSGDQFWQTFEAETPNWVKNGNRDFIRAQFRIFASTYCGFKPAGAWATNFSIICWPISHAIVPRDLQEHLADAIYQSSSYFTSAALRSPLELGRIIQRRGYSGSSRFQQLCQEQILIGQIASAILFHSHNPSLSLILPSTLARIIADIESIPRSKEHLNRARKSAIQTSGISAGSRTRQDAVDINDPQRVAFTPRYALIESNHSSSSYDLCLRIPTFDHLLSTRPELREPLSLSRCLISGAGERPLARGRLLYGSQEIKISDLSTANNILTFIPPLPGKMEADLNTLFPKLNEPILLKQVSDGGFYQITGKQIRPNSNYVLAFPSENLPDDLLSQFEKTEISCSGLSGVALKIEIPIDPIAHGVLEKYGLGISVALSIWPAGLTNKFWDGEGLGEWYKEDPIIIGLRCIGKDITLGVQLRKSKSEERLSLRLDDSKANFIDFSGLEIGNHHLSLTYSSNDGELSAPLGSINITVLPYPSEREFSRECYPVSVDVIPQNSSLEELLDGKSRISIRAPGREQVRITATTKLHFHENGVRKLLPRLKLPVDDDVLHELLIGNIQHSNDQRFVDSLSECNQLDLEFDFERFGKQTLSFERSPTPLRWLCRRVSGATNLRLVDNYTESFSGCDVSYFSFDKPIGRVSLGPDYGQSWEEQVLGGLYVASSGNFKALIVTPKPLPTRNQNQLAALQLNQNLQLSLDNPGDVKDALDAYLLWKNSEIVPNVSSSVLRLRVLSLIRKAINEALLSESWLRLENQFLFGFVKQNRIIFDQAFIWLGKKWGIENLAKNVVEAARNNPLVNAVEHVKFCAKLLDKQSHSPKEGGGRVWIIKKDANGNTIRTLRDRPANGVCEDGKFVVQIIKLFSNPETLILSRDFEWMVFYKQLLDKTSLIYIARLFYLTSSALFVLSKNNQFEMDDVGYCDWEWGE